jgi:hypothetical protein
MGNFGYRYGIYECVCAKYVVILSDFFKVQKQNSESLLPMLSFFSLCLWLWLLECIEGRYTVRRSRCYPLFVHLFVT